eukprot:c17794_g1_i1.p1 GENE.c17794_g1_i1~~c17794_g1_i1.p1  ORF type:complete len:305 (+),score=54.46 c17794_g1_i1:50-964(+)
MASTISRSRVPLRRGNNNASMTSLIPLTSQLSSKDNNLVGNLFMHSKMESTMFALTNSNQQHHPAVYASEQFYQFTGFTEKEIIGVGLAFLGCFDCCDEAKRMGVDRVRTAMALGAAEFVTCFVINFKKNGQPFVNQLSVRPLFDKNDSAVLFLYVSVPLVLDPVQQSMLETTIEQHNPIQEQTPIRRHSADHSNQKAFLYQTQFTRSAPELNSRKPECELCRILKTLISTETPRLATVSTRSHVPWRASHQANDSGCDSSPSRRFSLPTPISRIFDRFRVKNSVPPFPSTSSSSNFSQCTESV